VSAAAGTAWVEQLLPSAALGDAAHRVAANRRPSSLALSNRSVLENQPAGTLVGRLSAKDADRGERLTYSLVSGVGSGGNASFVLEGASLKTRAAFDRELQASYSIRVRVRDRAGATRERVFVVSVGDANDPPTGIGLERTLVMEQQDVGTEIGRLAAADQDARDNFTFTLVPGEGSADNAMFAIQGVWLRTNTVFVYALRQSYSLRVRATDGGTPALSFERVFTMRVAQQPPPPNAPPSFVRGSDLSVLEDAGAQTVPGWANTISPGPGESDQHVSFVMTGNSNPALFASGPTLASDGTLTYTPAGNAYGAATIAMKAVDDGTPTAESPPQSFTITVAPVDDEPSFDLPASADQLVLPGDTQTVAGFATNISSGPANESTQTVTFGVSNTNPALFTSQPAIAATSGDLTYTPAARAHGSATVSVSLSDNGGTANGGDDTSATKTFTISVDVPALAHDQTGGDAVAAIEDTAVQITLAATDADGDALTFSIVGGNGTVANVGAVNCTGSPSSCTQTLDYTPAPNANGPQSFTFKANDGFTDSKAATVELDVFAVNDAPSFTVPAAAPSVLEDAGTQVMAGLASAISAGAPDESGQTLTFVVVSNSNPGLFVPISGLPLLDATTGNLTFTPVANTSGTATIEVKLTDNGGTADGGVAESATQSFAITVTAVNDAPSFTKGGNQTVLEDAGAQSVTGWATAFSRGPADEAGQTISFEVTGNTNAGLFSSGPAVSSTGTLTFTPAANVYGTATITLRARDDGGTANGGVDASPAESFDVTVTPVNDVPSLTKGADQTVLEDSGARTVSGWATVSAGPNESAQSVTVEITNNTNAALFSVAPAVSPTGTLSYTPAPNANGTATITLRIKDDGGTANGGVDTSVTQTFQIVVASVNDAPSFVKGPNQTFDEDSGAHTITGWATGISVGPANESGQTFSFAITNTKPGLFSAGPSVAVNGTLSFTPAPNQNGTATITLKATDDGGTANGGVDESTQTFTITINALNDAPTSPGRAYGANSLQTNMQRSIDGASGLLAGALDADDVAGNAGYAPTFTVASLNGVAPTGGTINTTIAGVGTVVANAATGAFTIDPAPGVTGNVSFTYTVCDDGEGTPASRCTGTLTASFDIAGPVIWFVNSAAATNGSGTLTSPFNVLSAVPPVDAANHSVFLYSSAAGYTGAFSLNSGEALIGQPTTGTTFDALFGISPPAGTAARPTLGSGTATLTGTLTLASGVKLRGLSLATGASDALVGSGGLASVDVDQTAITTAAGTALNLNDVAGTITLTDLDKNGAGTGISLTNVGANVTIGSGATIRGTTAGAVRIDRGTGSFGYAGTIANSAGGTVAVTNRNTGSPGLVQFTGSVTAAGGTGVYLDNNDNGTVTFSGGLVLSTGTSPAYTAVSGGTVSVTGAANALTTSGATALNVADTTIGASGLTFKSISVGSGLQAGDSLPFSAIWLANTGASGGLTVTGDGNTSLGGNSSGGVIQNTSGDAISLSDTLSPSFTNVTIRGAVAGDTSVCCVLGSGIRGTGVTNFTFANGTINAVGHFTAATFYPNESDIRFDDAGSATQRNLSGTVKITGSVLDTAPWHGIDIANRSGTISDLTISGNSLTSGVIPGTCSAQDVARGRLCSIGNAINVAAYGSDTTAASITKAAITNNAIANFPVGKGIRVVGDAISTTGPGVTLGTPGSATNIVAITGNRIAGQSATDLLGSDAISVQISGGNPGSRAQGNFDVSSNGTVATPLSNMRGDAIAVTNAGYATTAATVTNNVIVAHNLVNDVAGVGIRGGNAFASANGPQTPDLTLTVTGNTISQTGSAGIYAFSGGSGVGTSGNAKVGIRNNTVGAPLSGVINGIALEAGGTTAVDDAICLDIRSNTSAGSGGAKGIGLLKHGTTSTTNDFGIEGMAATATPGVEQYVNGLNPAGGGTALLSATSGFSNCDTAP
jgi:hypothetical protein